jgi:cell division protein FtsL
MKRKSRKKFRLPGSLSVWLFFLVILIGELLFYTWCRVQCVEAGYKISEAKEGRSRLTTIQKNLKVELAGLKSPERIARIARNDFGLKMPGPGQIYIIP